MMARATTPSDLTIVPRDRRFGRGGSTARWWLGGDPYGTALYNALSATFPKGEAFFVESVRAFREGADPKLAGEIKAFTTQEVMHSREHVAFNKRAVEAGYDLSRLDKDVDDRLAIVRAKHPIVALPPPWRLSILPPCLPTSFWPIRATLPAPMRRRRRCGAGTQSKRSSIRA
jgi:predicted metal-dependent hydrolase